jgi:hypothetical protein
VPKRSSNANPMNNAGVPISLADRDLKNTLAWFGFEEVAYRMMEELGLA